MDATTTTGGPAVVWANWFRCTPSQRIHHSLVESVCFVWSVQGGGRIRSRGLELALEPGSIVRLPWGHDVEYVASERHPFHLGTVHLIPWHDAARPVEIEVAHDVRPRLYGDTARRDSGGAADRPLMVPSTSAIGRDVVALGTYTVERFMSRPMDDLTARALGRLVATESARFDTGDSTRRWPAALQAMTDFVIAEIARPLTVAEIARAGECSATTAQRLFVEHTGKSVIGWVRSTRMSEAARLLRTTSMRVSEVAVATGFADPLYFSRSFRQAFGVPPSRFVTGP